MPDTASYNLEWSFPLSFGRFYVPFVYRMTQPRVIGIMLLAAIIANGLGSYSYYLDYGDWSRGTFALSVIFSLILGYIFLAVIVALITWRRLRLYKGEQQTYKFNKDQFTVSIKGVTQTFDRTVIGPLRPSRFGLIAIYKKTKLVIYVAQNRSDITKDLAKMGWLE